MNKLARVSAAEAPASVKPEAVRQLIRDVWPDLKPHPATCADIAHVIGSLRVAKVPRPEKKAPLLGKAEKHGRAFLKHLEGAKVRLSVPKLNRLPPSERKLSPKAKAVLADMDMAARYVRAVIDGCREMEVNDMNLARIVFEHASTGVAAQHRRRAEGGQRRRPALPVYGRRVPLGRCRVRRVHHERHASRTAPPPSERKI